jgi:hypothetical protein
MAYNYHYLVKKTSTTQHSKKDATIKLTIIIWLVVSNIVFFPFHTWDVILPTENMFQDGDCTTNQIYNCHDFLMVFLLNHHVLMVHQVKQILFGFFRFTKPSEVQRSSPRPSRPALPPGAAPGRPAGMHGPVPWSPSMFFFVENHGKTLGKPILFGVFWYDDSHFLRESSHSLLDELALFAG